MPSSILKALWIGLVLCIHLCWASRIHPQLQQQQPHHKISLLIMRHGLSCANFVQKRSNYKDVGYKQMPDPLLTGIGQFAATEAGKAISKWFEQARQREDRISRVDATLTSALGRAIETSLLTFADNRLRAEVVPFLQQRGSDLPLSHNEQLQNLLKSLSKRNMTNFRVDYHWTDGVKAKTNSWDELLAFLADIYLPATLKRLRKGIGNRTVLAITTHNKWIEEALSKKCDLSSQKFSQLRVNGVLHLEYNFIQQAPSRGSMVAPFKLEEVSERQCEIIHEGSRAMDDPDFFKKLCVADIGEACIKSADRYAYSGSKVRSTLESQIVDLSNQMAQTESNIHLAQKHLTRIDGQLLIGTPEAADLKQSARSLMTDLDIEFKKLEHDLTRLQALKQGGCWSSGNPNTQGYIEQHSSLQLHELAPH